MDQTETFSKWLIGQLTRREWRQADLVERTKLSKSAISAYVNGQRVPDPASCYLIADALGVSLDIVLLMAGHRPNIEEIDPCDPKIMLHGLIDKINWTDGQVESMRAQLQAMVNWDRKGNRA